jgi:hypothetical protein
VPLAASLVNALKPLMEAAGLTWPKVQVQVANG